MTTADLASALGCNKSQAFFQTSWRETLGNPVGGPSGMMPSATTTLGLTDASSAVWTARTIWDWRTGTTDLVWNRQGTFGRDREALALATALDRGLLKRGLSVARGLAKAGRLLPSSETGETLLSMRGFGLVASTRGSFGYLYLTAWLPAHPGEAAMLAARWTANSAGKHAGIGGVPLIGDEVVVGMNKIGKSLVLGYFVEGQSETVPGGFLGLIVQPKRPPAYLTRQCGKAAPIGVFGADLKSPRPRVSTK